MKAFLFKTLFQCPKHTRMRIIILGTFALLSPVFSALIKPSYTPQNGASASLPSLKEENLNVKNKKGRLSFAELAATEKFDLSHLKSFKVKNDSKSIRDFFFESETGQRMQTEYLERLKEYEMKKNYQVNTRADDYTFNGNVQSLAGTTFQNFAREHLRKEILQEIRIRYREE
jgi:hypothetical protein